MANSDIEGFISAYGSRMLPQQVVLLRAAAEYFDSYPVDFSNPYKPSNTFATISVIEGESGKTDETTPGEFALTLPPPGQSAKTSVPVTGIPGWESSTFLNYDTDMAVVHELDHVILGLLSAGGIYELDLAVLAYVGDQAIRAATDPNSGQVDLLKVAVEMRILYGFHADINLVAIDEYGNPVSPENSRTLSPAQKLEIANASNSSHENLFNSQTRNFYEVAGISPDNTPSAYRVGYVAHAAQSNSSDPDKPWETYDQNTSFENVQGTLSNLIAANQPVAWLGNQHANIMETGGGDDYIDGGKGVDTLNGKGGFDKLLGGADNDTLTGGTGNDLLLGGAGDDTYVYAGDDGLDTILDNDGHNILAVDGSNLDGGAQYGDTRVHRSSDGRHLYVRPDAATLLIDGKLVIQGYGAGGDFGLTFAGPAAAADLPALTGDASDNYIGTDIYTRDPGDSRVTQATAPDGTQPAGELAGAAAANILEGGAGSDILSGGLDNDRLYADTRIDTATAIANGNLANSGSSLKGDWLAGGSGEDTLVGGAGRDVLAGGGGADLLVAGAGDDDILGDAHYVATSFEWTVTDQPGLRVFQPVTGTLAPTDSATDVIYAGEGKDYVWAGAGNDVVFGEGGDDRLNGNEGSDIILGGAGGDTLWGDIGHDWLDGGDGIDTLDGGADDDIIIGGAKDDTLYGGAGRDTYIFNPGDGRDTVIDTKADNNIFRFGAGFNPADVTLRLGSLMLDMGGGDEIHIDNFNQLDVFNSSSIGGFEFADGTFLTIDQLLERGFDLDGTDGDDEIIGTNTTDRIAGLAGNDQILGLDGNDTLTGGTGTDGMNGGLGDDTYILDAGDGAVLTTADGTFVEQIADDGGVDTLRFGAGVNPADIKLTGQADGSLVIDYSAFGQPADRLLIAAGQAAAIERFEIVGAGDTPQNLGYEQFVGEFGSGTYSGTDDSGRLHLSGGKTNDLIIVSEDDVGAIVSGGQGDDSFVLSGQNATAIVHAGDGRDSLDVTGQNTTLRFADQSADAITLGRSGLDLLLANATGDAITIAGWLNNDGLDAGVQTIEFADGTTWDGDAIRARLLAGTAGNDHLIGYAGADTLSGGAGSDWLEGRSGPDNLDGGADDDLLDGGAGADTMRGGAGTDVYRFLAGAGTDTVIDGGMETNVLRFEAWQSPASLRAVREGDDLQIKVRGTADGVTVQFIVLAYARIRNSDMLKVKMRRRISMPAAHRDTSWRMAA